MYFSRLLFHSLILYNIVAAQDTPNDDSDDALPSCAAQCQSSLGSLTDTCGNSNAISTFKSCVAGTRCSDDDQEGSEDWISSTCRVISRSMSRTSMSATATSSPASTTLSTTASTTGSSTGTTSSITTSSSSSSSLTSSTTSSTASATSTPTPTPQPQSSGLSIGAIVGIVIGALLGGLLLIGALIWFCARRMNQSRNVSKSGWPAAFFGGKGAKSSTYDGSERGMSGLGPGAGRFEPQDPFSTPQPHPPQPELGGVMRSELHSTPVGPSPAEQRRASAVLPLSLQAAYASQNPTGSIMVEMPHDGAVVAGPVPQNYRIPRKAPTVRDSVVSDIDPSDNTRNSESEGLLSPISENHRTVSGMSSSAGAAETPLPLSPNPSNSPTSRQVSQIR